MFGYGTVNLIILIIIIIIIIILIPFFYQMKTILT